jgi:hypothetical protein
VPRSDIVARDKVSLDLFWLRDESLEDLRSALAQIEDVLGDLEQRVATIASGT